MSVGGFAGRGHIDTRDPSPRKLRARHGRRSAKDGTGPAGRLDGPPEQRESSNDGSHGLDEEEPAHFAGVDHDKGELDCIVS